MTDLNYSNNLAVLLGQHPDELKVKYGPDRKLDKHEKDLYYRVYTGSEPTKGKIEQPLLKPLYTREMKTAIMKRWLDINSQENPLEPKFNIGVYLSKPEQYSTLFHLMELGDKNAEKYYSLVNYDISNNEDLFQWLHEHFKGTLFLSERMNYLSFKYLSDKLTGNFTKPEEGDLIGLTDELLNTARNAVVYEEKRELVNKHLPAFITFTSDPRHFEYVKDLDYFFLVFESFFSFEAEAGGEEEEAEEAAARVAAEAQAEAAAEEEEAAAEEAEAAAARVAAEAEAEELADRKAHEELASQEALKGLQNRKRRDDLPQGEKHEIKEGIEFENIKMIETQVGAGCGIHAFKNLLQRQIDTKHLAAVVNQQRESVRENLEILLQKKLESSDSEKIINRIIQNIDETKVCATQMLSIQEISILLDLTVPEEEGFTKYGHQNINFDFLNTLGQIIDENRENFIGFIQNLSAKRHFVAWILKDGNWYEVNSRVEGNPNLPGTGTITKYTIEEFNQIFTDNTDELLAVYKIPETSSSTGAGRIRKNKSKRRYTSKKRTGKKSKKIRY